MYKNQMINEISELLEVYKYEIDSDMDGLDITLAADRLNILDMENGNSIWIDWAIQTGNNEFYGSAYSYNTWAVNYLYPDSDCQELAEELVNELIEMAFQ